MLVDRLSFLSIFACCFSSCSPVAQAACPALPLSAFTDSFLEGVQSNLSYRPGLSFDAYAPPGPPRPAALLIHGSSGDRSTHLTQLFPHLSNAGYAWFSVDYRSLADLQGAASFIECPGRFPIEPRLTLIAEDTGVQLALELAHHLPHAIPVRQVIAFGSTTKLATLPDPHLPLVLFHGAADTDAAPAPLEKACRAWTNCRFVSIPHGIHNLENWHPAEWEWREEFSALLRNGRRGLWPNIVYSRPGGLPLAMDAHIPAVPTPSPAVIVVHGGGWEAGDKSTYVSPVLSLLSPSKFAWFSIDYRLTPYVRNRDQVEDLRSAIRYVRLHAARYHVDPKRIALLGESAGGQLVAQVVSEPCSDCQVQAVVSFYGVYDFTRWAADPESKPMLDRIFGTWNMALLRRYSPLFHVHPGMPPMFLLQGTADELYTGTLAYEKQLKQHNVPHSLILLNGAPHGMENWVGNPEWETYRPKLLAWLDSVLRF